MDPEKLPAATEYSFAHTFYPVPNIRGGFAHKALESQQSTWMINLPQFEVRTEIMMPPKRPKQKRKGF